jgi:biopolymer transport protein ExbD
MPITPMLDMSFQLLFFFILNYHAPANECEIRYDLPTHELAQPQPPENPLPGDPDPGDLKIDADLTILVRMQHDGFQDGHINEVRVREDHTGRETTLPIPNGRLEELVAFLTRTRPELANRDDIFIQGDRRLKWSGMVKVMDACRNAGFLNVGFRAPAEQ